MIAEYLKKNSYLRNLFKHANITKNSVISCYNFLATYNGEYKNDVLRHVLYNYLTCLNSDELDLLVWEVKKLGYEHDRKLACGIVVQTPEEKAIASARFANAIAAYSLAGLQSDIRIR